MEPGEPGGGASLYAVDAQMGLNEGVQQNQVFAAGSLEMSLYMIEESISFGSDFLVGGSNSVLVAGGTIDMYGLYHQGVAIALKPNG